MTTTVGNGWEPLQGYMLFIFLRMTLDKDLRK